MKSYAPYAPGFQLPQAIYHYGTQCTHKWPLDDCWLVVSGVPASFRNRPDAWTADPSRVRYPPRILGNLAMFDKWLPAQPPRGAILFGVAPAFPLHRLMPHAGVSGFPACNFLIASRTCATTSGWRTIALQGRPLIRQQLPGEMWVMHIRARDAGQHYRQLRVCLAEHSQVAGHLTQN